MRIIIDNNKKLYLYLFELFSQYSRDTPCQNNLIFTFNINDVGSENLSCQIMVSSTNGEVLTCFYRNGNSEVALRYIHKFDKTLNIGLCKIYF